MAILGNILLLLASLVLFFLIKLLSGKMPGGDAGVGYAWSFFYLLGIFLLLMVIATLVVGGTGGFEWISPNTSRRRWIVAVTLLSCLFTFGLTALMQGEIGHSPAFFRILATIAPVLIGVVLIASGFILVNANLRDSVPMSVYKWPLVIVGCLGVAGVAGTVGQMVWTSVKRQAAVLTRDRDALDDNDRRMIAEIERTDVLKDMVLILVMTDGYKHPEVRAKAVAKVKTHPDFEGELMRRLETPWAPQIFTFLASNDVSDPKAFAEPVRKGILQQAQLFREQIRNVNHPSNFYKGMFNWDVERIIRTVDKFEGQGVDYLEAMKALRAAMDEPSEYEYPGSDFKRPKFSCIPALEKWIRKHQ